MPAPTAAAVVNIHSNSIKTVLHGHPGPAVAQSVKSMVTTSPDVVQPTLYAPSMTTGTTATPDFPTGGQTTRYPADADIAVGHTYIVQTVNEQVSIWNKSTFKIVTGFNLVGTNFVEPTKISDCGDPRTLYLQAEDRWLISCTGVSVNSTKIFIAVSTSNNPGGTWNRYYITDPNGDVLDQLKVNATSDKIIYGGDVFNFLGVGLYTKLGVCSRSAMVAGQPISCPLYEPRIHYWDSIHLGSAVATGHLVAGGGQDVYLLTVTGTPPNSVSVSETDAGTFGFNSTLDTSIPGPATLGDGHLDDRIMSAVEQVDGYNGHLMVDFASTQGSCGVSGNDCVVIGSMDMSSGSPVLVGNYVETEGSSFNYTFPAITKDAYGHIFVAYERHNATNTPMATELAIDPVSGNQLFNQIIYGNIAGSTGCGDGTCSERWGDYNGAVQDPDDHTRAWVVATYQAGNGRKAWGTVIALANSSGTLCC